MIAHLGETALRRAGLELRIPKCTWFPAQRREQDLPEILVATDRPNLQTMRELGQDECLQVLGTFIQC